MSGRIVTTILLIGCISCASYALWRRSGNTAHVRKFWTARGAWMIQHAPVVKFRRLPELAFGEGEEILWLDVSQAPGLIHLRATLVDDRYFTWSSLTDISQPSLRAMKSCQFRFANDEGLVDVWINEGTGQVCSLATSQAVELIPASRDAVRAFLADWPR